MPSSIRAVYPFSGGGRAALLLCALAGLPALLNASGALDRARAYFDDARAAHSQLQRTPMPNRTMEEYARLVENFRRVYLTAPTYGNSTISLMAIGELSEEMARRWSEPQYFQQALDAYAFILREYPQSQFRFDARLAIARIYRHDLNKPEKALEQFERYLADYPNSAQSKLARLAVSQLRDELGPPGGNGEFAANQSKQGALSGKPAAELAPQAKAAPAAGPASGPAAGASSPLAPITDIRYWSNPETSRVVIDVGMPTDGQKLKYQAAQLSSPPRLYIDLHDTRIPKPAGGRTLEVNGELLKRVRLAQFDKRVSRLVLDLGADTEYQISEMTNPYRLVIDVHGKISEIDAAIPVAAVALGATFSAGASATNVTPVATAAPAALATSSSAGPAPNATKPEPPAVKVAIAKPAPAAAAISSVLTLPALPEPSDARVVPPAEPKVEAKTEVAATAKNDVMLADARPHQSPAAQITPSEKPAVSAASSAVEPTPAKTKTAAPINGGTHSLTRALGLKIGRIFIDAGHGGHDTGTIGPSGLTEKEITLDVAQRLGILISEKLGSEVVHSRNDDTFIPLESRVAMANQTGADLFLSVHLNSSTAKNAMGIETYYLNFTSDPEALKVAARENSGAQETIANLQGIVRKIALQEKLDESREFAVRMQASLRKSLAKGMTHKTANQFDRGVKTAPFVVLIGASMPSVLAEVSFLSNPAEEKRLRTTEYRQKLAEALFTGVSSYVDSLSGVKIAPHLPTPEPPMLPAQKDKGSPAKAQSAPPAAPRKDGSVKPEKTASTQPENMAQLR